MRRAGLKIGLLVVALSAMAVMLIHRSSPRFVKDWEDDFSGLQLDETKWTVVIGDGCPDICGWGNNELQYYTDLPSNVRLQDGNLIIEAHKQAVGNRMYTSAKLVTKEKADWQYGKIEIRAKLPQGRGTWPAFWMLPTLSDRSLQWPDDGEIDIMEHVGYNQGMIYGTIHTGKYNHQIGTQRSDSLMIADAHSVFHVYGIEWSPEKISWFVDDQVYLTLLKNNDDRQGWPFDERQFHLIINLAVGGNWGGRMGVDDTIWPQQLTIDYIRHYQLQQ